MEKKLSICFATEDFYPSFIGGQGIWGKYLVEELARQGHDVTMLAENRPDRNEYWKKVKNVHLQPVPYCFGNQLILALAEYLTFKSGLGGRQFDVVHANQLTGLFFCLRRPPNATKIVVSVHNTYADMLRSRVPWGKRLAYRLLMLLERIIYRRADALLFHTAYERWWTIRHFHVDENKCFLAHPGVLKTKFTQSEKKQARAEIRHRYGIPATSGLVLYVGRLVRRKNVDLLIRAARRMPGITLVIVGSGTDLPRLRLLAGPNVKFAGRVHDVRWYYLAADCFCLLSDAEGGVSLSVLEAASFQVPVVVSAPAASFDIKQGINGFVVDPKRTHAVMTAVSQALTDPSVGMRGERMVRPYTWENCVRDTLRAYR